MYSVSLSIIISISLGFLRSVGSFMIDPPYLLGTYLLRKTNDISFDSKYTYLVVNDNNIKLKTIYQNWIIATKKSRTGSVTFIPESILDIVNPAKILKKTFRKRMNKVDNDVDLRVKFNSLNKYTYSMFGIEFPEIKYEEISNYNIQKNIRIQVKDTTLYITDDFGNYYLFDIYPTVNLSTRMPYVETAIYTLIFTEILSTVINVAVMKVINQQ